jgi:hypothetical protein
MRTERYAFTLIALLVVIAIIAVLICMNHHTGYVNYPFADLSLRKVGLKELWTFKWNRTVNTSSAWTRAGGGPA